MCYVMCYAMLCYVLCIDLNENKKQKRKKQKTKNKKRKVERIKTTNHVVLSTFFFSYTMLCIDLNEKGNGVDGVW